jgi:hypothetical protein
MPHQARGLGEFSVVPSGRSFKRMVSFTDLACGPADHKAPSTDRLRLAVAAYLARFTGSSVSTPNRTCLLPVLVRRTLRATPEGADYGAVLPERTAFRERYSGSDD